MMECNVFPGLSSYIRMHLKLIKNRKMKKIAILLSVVLLPLLAAAQKSPVDKLFDKYYGREGFTTVLVNPEMFEVISKMEKQEGPIEGDMGGVMGKIKRVRVLAQEGESDNTSGINFMDELRGADFDDYKELVVVKEAEEEVMVLAKEEGSKLSELLVLVGGKENVLVSIEGLFDMEDLESLSDLDELDVLDDILE